MPKSLYLAAPRSAPGAFGADAFEHWGFPPVQGIADVALTTVAALAPPDFDVRVCDETVSPIEFDTAADFVGVTGKITQRESCSAAGLNHVFIGIETPNRAALRETRKRQNLLDDPLRQVRRFLAHGVMVRSGMVVGFDADGPDIFERQFEFAMSSPIPIFSIATLAAPEATPLHARMRESGRLIEGRNGTATLPWETNVVPARMTGEQMSIGMRWLANRLYHPPRFGDRVVRLVEDVVPSAAAPDGAGEGPPARRRLDRTMTALMQRFLRSDAELKEMGVRLERAVRRKPSAGRFVRSALRSCAQIRCLYDRGGYWDPGLARLDAPPIGA